MLHFTIFHNNEHIKTYEITTTPFTIGRLPENEISIASISVSRKHIRIEQDASKQYILTDLNSLNGTYVNNQKVTITKLFNNDKITIGKYTIVLEIIPENSELLDTVSIPKPFEAHDQSEDNKINVNENNTIVNNEVEEEEIDDSGVYGDTGIPVFIEINKHLIYKLVKKIVSIGISEDDDIFVEGFLISDGHAVLEKRDDGFYLHANKLLGSVKVNGKKINSCKLEHKDKVEIGKNLFRYMENGNQ